MLGHLETHLKGKVVILGVGNALRSDDGAGSILANRLKDTCGFTVYDAGATPENYLEKIIRDRPDTVVIVDAADLGVKAGEYTILEQQDLKTFNLFSTHNTSISLTINYLQSRLSTDIIVLVIQPRSIAFGDNLSPEVSQAIENLEHWFKEVAKKRETHDN